MISSTTRSARRCVSEWIDRNADRLSEVNSTIWNFAESALREYRSSSYYTDLLEREGFEVERGSAGMPTAFVARYGSGSPVVATYAEYDAIPGISQAPEPRRQPRDDGNPWAPGHGDPHSALGASALGGALSVKAAMERHNLPGTLLFFGEPGEKICASKNAHAAHGYYDDIDAAVSFHPTFIPELTNTVVLDTHCGSFWSVVFSFTCTEPGGWVAAGSMASPEHAHATATARAPGALDAVCFMHMMTKASKENMLPFAGNWSVNEAVLVAGQATADNLPPNIGQIQYVWRSPDLGMQEKILGVLRCNAEAAARTTHCDVQEIWVAKTRPGLPNHSLARLVYRNLAEVGPPRHGPEAIAFGQALQRELGLRVTDAPFIEDLETLRSPEESEQRVRSLIPEWQRHYSVDDYTEYTWHAPTARLYVARPVLAPQTGHAAPPDWTFNAMGGVPACIDPMIRCAAETIGLSLVELLTDPAALEAAQAEFRERTGGGIGGQRWQPPLFPPDFRVPVDLRWPEYVVTPRGEGWSIPAFHG